MAKISIIVPVYKVENYIRRCVDSILAQTFSDFELILVDDGSPDNCGKICEEYAKKDERIVVIHKENGGLSDARNAGIDWSLKKSSSRWITFIDSDDWIHPNYLEFLYRAAKNTNCKISICGYDEIREGNGNCVSKSPLFKVPTIATIESEEFFCSNYVNSTVAWGKLYKKQLFDNIRYPFGKLHEDEFTTYKVLFLCEKIAYINHPLYYYLLRNSSIMGSSFSLKRYDGAEALEERKTFLTERGLLKAWEENQKRYELVLAKLSLEARKNGLYSKVPSKYKVTRIWAIKTLQKYLPDDIYEYIIYDYSPIIAKLLSIKKKLTKQ